MNTIPTKINRYNVYNKGNRLLGVGEEMTLPDFEPSSETVTGAGILGEIDDPTVGYFRASTSYSRIFSIYSAGMYGAR